MDLIESDAWLHGAATVKALPKAEATIALTLYDTSSLEMATFSGTLGADGSVSLKRGIGHCACDPGYAGPSCEKDTVCTDVDVLAAELFPGASGYEIGIDLNGVDTYEVAYATVEITEEKTTTKAEVGWDAMGSVWEGDLTLEHEGMVEIKTKTWDKAGDKIDSSKVKLGVPWNDGGYGVTNVASDEDPMTSLAISRNNRGYGQGKYGMELDNFMTIVSTGWTVGSTMPVAASLELEGGSTLSIPVNSYQVVAEPYSVKFGDEVYYAITISGGDVVLDDSTQATFEDRSTITSSGGFSFMFEDAGDGTFTVSVAAYAADAGKLPTDATVVITTFDKSGTKLSSDTMVVDFEDDVALVFANVFEPSEDPSGVDLAGKISLLGAADKKGKQKTLSKGKFYGSLTRDYDGDLALAGADKDVIDAKGDILIGGEPIDFELTDTDGDGEVSAPPVILLMTTGNGKGTRVVATSNTGSPGLL